MKKREKKVKSWYYQAQIDAIKRDNQDMLNLFLKDHPLSALMQRSSPEGTAKP